MKKVKITVLRVTFNEDFAQEYGMPGLQSCQVMQPGQVFMPVWENLTDFVMELGGPFINMYLLWQMVHSISILMIGCDNPVWRLPVAMMGYALSFSNLRRWMKRYHLHL